MAETLAEGVRLFEAGDREGAHQAFGRAYRQAPSDPRVQSWYGLTLVLVERNSNLGVVLVDRAVRFGRDDPEQIINQARVAMALGQRARAVRALDRGLVTHPGDTRIADARAALGTRQRPVVPFLSRSNWFNRMFGRIHHRWMKQHPASGAEPRTRGEE